MLVVNLQNIFMEHDLYLISKLFLAYKIDNFDPYNIFLTVATNIPILLKTGFVVRGKILVLFLIFKCTI